MKNSCSSKLIWVLILALVLNSIAFLFTGSAYSERVYEPRIETETEIESVPESKSEMKNKTESPVADESMEYDEIIVEIAEKYSVSATLIRAIIKTESDFEASLISETDDYGLMQINICNKDWLENTLGVTDLLDPMQNIESGVYILSGYLSRYGLSDALMAYNCGESGAKRLWAKNIHSTRYTEKVLKNLNEFGGYYE